MILKRFFLMTWLIFFLSSAIANEAVYSPGTGLLVGNLKTNQYFILDGNQPPPTKVLSLSSERTNHKPDVLKLRLALHKMKSRFISQHKTLMPRVVTRQAMQHKHRRHHSRVSLISFKAKHLALHKKTKLILTKRSKHKHGFAMKNSHRHLALRRLVLKNSGKG